MRRAAERAPNACDPATVKKRRMRDGYGIQAIDLQKAIPVQACLMPSQANAAVLRFALGDAMPVFH